MAGLAKLEESILRLLLSGSSSGRKMVKDSNDELKIGSIYVTLQRMEEKGLITSEIEKLDLSEKFKIPKRIYTITTYGEQVFYAQKDFEQTLTNLERLKEAFNV